MFVKISYSQWEKDYKKFVCTQFDDTYTQATCIEFNADECRKYYDSIELPARATINSAGYDFKIPYPFKVHAQHSSMDSSDMLLTGIRWIPDNDSLALFLFARSGKAHKNLVSLTNAVGLIDGDYYESDNEGHIMISLNNDIYKKCVSFEANTAIAQGVIMPFVTDDGEEIPYAMRTGGHGSTGN